MRLAAKRAKAAGRWLEEAIREKIDREVNDADQDAVTAADSRRVGNLPRLSVPHGQRLAPVAAGFVSAIYGESHHLVHGWQEYRIGGLIRYELERQWVAHGLLTLEQIRARMWRNAMKRTRQVILPYSVAVASGVFVIAAALQLGWPIRGAGDAAVIVTGFYVFFAGALLALRLPKPH